MTDLSSSGDQYVAHDKYYRQVLVPKIPQIMGTWVKVTVESTGKYFIIGSLMDDDLSQAATGPAGQLESDPKVPRLIRGQRGLVRATASDKEAHDGTAFSAPTPSSSSDVTPTTPSRWTAPRWLLTTSFIVAYTGLILMTDVRRSVKFGATVGLGFLLHSQYDTQKR